MRVLGPADGLPAPPIVDFALYVRRVPAVQAAAVQALQSFLGEELNIIMPRAGTVQTAGALLETQ